MHVLYSFQNIARYWSKQPVCRTCCNARCLEMGRWKCETGKCGTGKWGTNARWKLQNRKMRETALYGKPYYLCLLNPAKCKVQFTPCTVCCDSGDITLYLLNPVYTIQPVVKPGWQPVWQPCWTSSHCSFNRVERTATVRSTGCQTGLYNRFDNRLYRVNRALSLCFHQRICFLRRTAWPWRTLMIRPILINYVCLFTHFISDSYFR